MAETSAFEIVLSSSKQYREFKTTYQSQLLPKLDCHAFYREANPFKISRFPDE